MVGCANTPVPVTGQGSTVPVCDSYVFFEMCVQDLVADGAVDLIYFSNTRQVFMYREGMQDTVASAMPLHPCAVVLDGELQLAMNLILARDSLSMRDEFGIKRLLLSRYLAAKPEIDACNARVKKSPARDGSEVEDFYMGDSGWEEDPHEFHIGDSDLMGD